jgi:hypothetical protein
MNRRITACAILLAWTGLLAGEAPGPAETAAEYWVIVVPDGASGVNRSENFYEMAVYRMPGDPEESHAAMLSSLCVSHTLVGQFRHAQRHCDGALEATREAAGGNGETATELALAYSNRGVLRARAGDPEGAEADFRTALELGAATGIPTRNLAQLLQREAPP